MSVVPSSRPSCSHHEIEVREQQNPLLAGVCGHCSHVPTVPGIFSYIGVMGYILYRYILRERLRGQHGTAFRAYVEALAIDLNEHCAWMKTDIRRLVTVMTPEGAGNQVGRAINRFALVAAAGELATHLGITGWQVDQRELALMRGWSIVATSGTRKMRQRCASSSLLTSTAGLRIGMILIID